MLNRQVTRFVALEYFINIDSRTAENRRDVRSIGNKPAGFYELLVMKNCRKAASKSQLANAFSIIIDMTSAAAATPVPAASLIAENARIRPIAGQKATISVAGTTPNML